MCTIPGTTGSSRRRAVGLLALGAAVAACSHQPADYAWSHPAGGEYLFAFDVRDCRDQVRSGLEGSGLSATAADRSPQFFACMDDRGYFLVDPATGLALTPRPIPEPGSNPQARR